MTAIWHTMFIIHSLEWRGMRVEFCFEFYSNHFPMVQLKNKHAVVQR